MSTSEAEFKNICARLVSTWTELQQIQNILELKYDGGEYDYDEDALENIDEAIQVINEARKLLAIGRMVTKELTNQAQLNLKLVVAE